MKIRGGASGPLDERLSILASGPGVVKLREQVATQEKFFTVRNGTVNPFEDLDEKNLQPLLCRVFQQYLRSPIPKRSWFSVMPEKASIVNDGGSPALDPASDAGDEQTNFLGLDVNSMGSTSWEYATLEAPELAGLIFGVSEYICNDFGIQSQSRNEKSRRYPSDSRVCISWTPSSSALEVISDKGHTLMIDLDAKRVEDLRKLCDEVISRQPTFVRLNLPSSSTNASKGVWSTVLRVVAATSIVAAGIWLASRSLGRKHAVEDVPSGSKKEASVVKVKETKSKKSNKKN